MRKGGIREPHFKPQGDSFFLFPTAFHSDIELLKPGVSERYSQVSIEMHVLHSGCLSDVLEQLAHLLSSFFSQT